MVRPPRQGGFTVTELMLVALVVGLISSMVIGAGSAGSSPKVELAAAEVAAALRHARDETLRTAAVHGIYVQPASNRIRVYRADTGTTPATPVFDVYDPVTRRLWDFHADTHPLAEGVDLSGVVSLRGSCSVPVYFDFRTDATPVCADTPATLVEEMRLTLTFGGLSRVVVLDGFTARVRIE